MQDTGLSDCPTQPTKLSRKALCHYLSMSESPCSTKIVLDCGYDHLMSFKGICKLANQISSCYAFNRRSTIPVQLYVTGLNPSGSTRSTNDSSVHLIDRLLLVGSDHWDIHLVDDDFYNVFDQKSIVYLCAESPHILPDCFPSSTPDPSLGVDLPISLNDIFVIGGLVDHNHRPGYCYEQATRRGYRTARLPISESGIRMNCRRVLSTFEVFKALAPVIAGTSTWSDSLEAAIPSRKKLN
ncbi:unnamed protein product [Dicrocoelium dendriticum]|nr:unnamed protein product [Dicrocoelium dendriticum]